MRDDGDLQAFYAVHVAELTMQLYAYTGDMPSAQDCVQEAFCRALPRWERVMAYDNPVAWVRRVALNLASSRWRHMRTTDRFFRSQRETTVPGPEPDQVALTDALRTLPIRHRRAIVLYYLASMTTSEIAVQEGVSDATVRVWLHRGRAALAELLADDADGSRSKQPATNLPEARHV